MLKSKTSTALALSRWLNSGRRGKWCALRHFPSHAVVGPGHRGAVNASDIIAIQAVVLGAHDTAGHSQAKITGRGEASSTAAVAGVRGLSLTKSPANEPLVPSGMPITAAGTESLLHRSNGRSRLIG